MWTGGIPEGFELDHLKNFLEIWKPTGRFGTAIDGGAHRGVWARELAKHFDRVIALEANPTHAKHLMEQCAETRNVQCFNIALGKQHDYVGTAYHGVQGNTGACHVEGSGLTPMMRLDDTSWPIDFLKLDIEGMELFALEGASEKIGAHRPAIMVELNGNGKRFYGVSDGATQKWLEDRDYELAMKANKDHFYVPR